MKPSSFTYHRFDDLADVTEALTRLGDDAKLLAGGQSLVPMMNMRLARFEHLIDIARIHELKTIERSQNHVVIGAAVRHCVVERDAIIESDVRLLHASAPLIGHFQIRSRGTIGGSLAHADPAAEQPAVAVALDALFDVVSSRGSRTIAAEDFFIGLWATSMDPDEVLRAVSFPVWSGRIGVGIAEFSRRHGDFAIAGAAVQIEVSEHDEVTRSAMSLFGMSGTPHRARSAEAHVTGHQVANVDAIELGRLAVADITDVTEDSNVSTSYRRDVGAAMLAEAWRQAVADTRRETR